MSTPSVLKHHLCQPLTLSLSHTQTQMTDDPVVRFQWMQSKQTVALLSGRTLRNEQAGFVHRSIRS